MKLLKRNIAIDKTAASSIHPEGEPVSENSKMTDGILTKNHSVTFSVGLPRYFHAHPHRGESDISNGCIVQYSLNHFSITEGDAIARKWAAEHGFEEIGSGCAMVGDPIRDMDFVPIRTLPTFFTPHDDNCILPRLYTLEINGTLITVKFETRRIPLSPPDPEKSESTYTQGFNSIRSFLDRWAENHGLRFCSSCLNVPDDPSDFSDTCNSYCSYAPAKMNGKVKLDIIQEDKRNLKAPYESSNQIDPA